MKDLKDTIYDLEHELGSIGCNVETLEDIQTELCILRQDMEGIDYKNNFSYLHFKEIYRKVRVLDQLFYYTLEELKPRIEDASKATETLFDKVIRGEKHHE